MKKSIKKLLIFTQVLGWSALVATACTDDQVNNNTNSSVGKSADSKNPNTTSNTKPDNKENSNSNGGSAQGVSKDNNQETQGPNATESKKPDGESTDSTKDMSHNPTVAQTSSIPEAEGQKAQDGQSQTGTNNHAGTGSEEHSNSDHMSSQPTMKQVVAAKGPESDQQGETSAPAESTQGHGGDGHNSGTETEPGHKGLTGPGSNTPGTPASDTPEHK